MIKVVGLLGSPRQGSHTDTLLAACLAGAEAAGAETTKLSAYDFAIKPCFSCYHCAKTGECTIKNDQMSQLVAELAEADIIILASPLYFAGVSAPVKAIIDRSQLFWSRQNTLGLPALLPEKRRLGVFLGTGGAPNRAGNNFAPAIATVKLWFQSLQVDYQEQLTAADTDRVPVAEREDLLSAAKALGEKLVQGAHRP